MFAFGTLMSAFGIDIEPRNIAIIPPGTSKLDALNILIDTMSGGDAVQDAEAFRRAVHEREAVMSTGIGGGVAIPHVRIPEIRYASMGVAVAPEGIDYGTLDNKPVHIMVLFATPEGADKEYLRLLAQVMAALKNRPFYERLVACRSTGEVYEVLQEGAVDA
jgi:mannitol/fructose-specific phosphotransferase system IIA component (Ntr-type)